MVPESTSPGPVGAGRAPTELVPEAWHAWHRAVQAEYEGIFLSRQAEAERHPNWRAHRAYTVALSAYAQAVPHGEALRGVCIGCGKPVRQADALEIAPERWVHYGDEWGCVLRYGAAWRSAAREGLAKLGINPPDDYPSE